MKSFPKRPKLVAINRNDLILLPSAIDKDFDLLINYVDEVDEFWKQHQVKYENFKAYTLQLMGEIEALTKLLEELRCKIQDLQPPDSPLFITEYRCGYNFCKKEVLSLLEKEIDLSNRPLTPKDTEA